VTATNDANVVLQDGYVPVIDLGLSAASDATRRSAVVNAITKACDTSGFFVVAGHGVPQATIDNLHRVAREFFALPDGVKGAVAADPLDPLQRGYTPNGDIQVFSANRLGEPGVAENNGIAHPNRWPDVPGFREACLTYYEALGTLSLEIMRLLAAALLLPEDWFDDKFDRHMTPMSINYYPALAEPAPAGTFRHDAHADFGTVTLLHQDDGPGGLQVMDQDQQWVDVAPIPGTFVVNLGRLMTMWTNDRWPSTIHRVVFPSPEKIHLDRVSVAYFSQPNPDAVVSCIPTCADEQNPARHRDISSADFILSRTRRVFLRRTMQLRAPRGEEP
jgi:isopenicillin N synthase-like dioxygenase